MPYRQKRFGFVVGPFQVLRADLSQDTTSRARCPRSGGGSAAVPLCAPGAAPKAEGLADAARWCTIVAHPARRAIGSRVIGCVAVTAHSATVPSAAMPWAVSAARQQRILSAARSLRRRSGGAARRRARRPAARLGCCRQTRTRQIYASLGSPARSRPSIRSSRSSARGARQRALRSRVVPTAAGGAGVPRKQSQQRRPSLT
mmetsp:Transcript_118701/g.295979  ORF Transcript_118701/g.295979 Transcript_118701/m.295979 type:complete len:202 (-) Transcript_118701:69-674(-)